MRAAGDRRLRRQSRRSRCSVLTYSSFRRSASASAAVVTWRRRGDSDDLRPAVRARRLAELGAHGRRDRRRIDVHLPHDLRHDAVALLDQRQQQVLRRDLRMSLAIGELLRREDRFLGLLCVLVDVHRSHIPESGQLPALRFQPLLPPAYSLLPTYLLHSDLLATPRSAAAVPASASGAAGRRPSRTDRRDRSGLPTAGMPWPFNRKTWPFCVVSGIFSRTDPVIVGTCASPPSTAVVTGTPTLVWRSSPLRSNIGCGRMRTRRNRSPAAPPFDPDSPSPAARTREPSLTPDGNPDVHAARVPTLLDRDAPHRAVERLFERQLDLVLDVAPLLAAGGARLARGGRLRAARRRRRTSGRNPRTGSSLPKRSCISSSVIVR